MTTANPIKIDDVKKISFLEAKEEELKSIQKLRVLNKEEKQENIDKTPDNLVGLAFSGGGIRRATFGLGVREALKKFGLLNKPVAGTLVLG